MNNTITAFFKGRTGVAESLYQYDYGQILIIDGLDLPAAFEVHFSASGDDEAVVAIGENNRVAIPDSCLTKTGTVTAHIIDHTGENDGETEYVVRFAVMRRARPNYDENEKSNWESAAAKALAMIQNPRKVNTPLDDYYQVDNGKAGQVLRTKGDGSTEWVYEGLPTDEQTSAAVNAWLDEHPEATTTVLDGSITKVKLDSNLKSSADIFIHNEAELAEAINNPKYKAYILGEIEINETINISHSRNASNITFLGGRIILNAPMFTNSSIIAGSGSSAWAIPNFIGTFFQKGNYDTIFDSGFYILWGRFTACYFENISFTRASIVVQGARFSSCFFIADADTPAFLHANAIYDVKFSDCDWEASYVPMLIDLERDTTWGLGGGSTMRQVSFVNCISEGRSNSLVRFNVGDVRFYGHYAEGNSAPIVDVYKAADQTYQNHSISFVNCFLNTADSSQLVVLIEEDYNYENTAFVCIGSEINNCILVNSNKFLRYTIEGCKIVGTATVFPSKGMSKVLCNTDCGAMGRCWTNGLAFFKQSSRKIYLKPELVLLSFMTPFNGSYTTFIVIAGYSSTTLGNAPFAYCISHPSITITVSYNSELGLLELTLPDSLGALSYSRNLSAVALQRLTNDSTGIDYYRSKARNGYEYNEFGEIFVNSAE